MNIALYNTLSRRKETLALAPNQPVKMYVCGVTPYDYAHIGHGRVYVNADLLVRLLRFTGHEVIYVRNITDIDDKLLAKAAQQGNAKDYRSVAEHFTTLFQNEMKQLGCLAPTHEPRVTECIPGIIAFVLGLIDKGHAYVLDGDVYFDVASFPSYGALSKRNLDDMLAGARVDVNEKKRHPADFALWKGNKENLFWQSPWGYGRPGWHIECSVMANKYLGTTIDIHGGGMDLIFPHHENELAQSAALHDAPLAHTWLHNAFVNINKEKMSKSLGNIISLHTLFEKYDPMVVRFYYLQHHYRTPIDFSDDDMTAAQTAYKRLVAAFESVSAPADSKAVPSELLEALCDDLNTPKFFGMVFERLAVCKNDISLAQALTSMLINILGLTLEPLREAVVAMTPEIEKLVRDREQARSEKNWALADKIRDELAACGYKVQDKKTK
ncbi:MAG: cysteine--tRNA ligase [Candidatus Babeliales bacterium]|jgi:cysteinyl-tRNA synthetase